MIDVDVTSRITAERDILEAVLSRESFVSTLISLLVSTRAWSRWLGETRHVQLKRVVDVN